MTREEFNSLNTNDRAFTVEGYIDGFKSAIEVAESVIVRVDDSAVDELFVTNKAMIVDALKASLKRIAEAEGIKV